MDRGREICREIGDWFHFVSGSMSGMVVDDKIREFL